MDYPSAMCNVIIISPILYCSCNLLFTPKRTVVVDSFSLKPHPSYLC